MGALVSHVVSYVVVNGFLVAVWYLNRGSGDALRAVIDDPTTWRDHHFWPIWVMLAWGVGLALHAGTWLSLAPRRARRRLQRAVRHRPGHRRPKHGHPKHGHPGPILPGPPAAPTGPVTEAPTGPVAGRRWVAVMFGDIVGSTGLAETLGDEAYHRVLTRFRGVVRAALAGRQGVEVGTAGDGFLARFESPADAVLCGIDIQQALEAQLDGEPDIRVRIGIHAGDAVEDGGDLVGHVINLAARVSTEASPGEILVTEPVADQLVGRLELEDRGLRPLKGLSQPRHLLAVRWSGGQAEAATTRPGTVD